MFLIKFNLKNKKQYKVMDETNYHGKFTKICRNIDVQNYIKVLLRYYHNKNDVPEYVNYDLFLEMQCELLTEHFTDSW